MVSLVVEGSDLELGLGLDLGLDLALVEAASTSSGCGAWYSVGS